jgi:acyl carrier protein
MKEGIRNFVQNELINEPDFELNDTDNLLAAGLIDSMGLMRLVAFVQEEYKISIPTEDIVMENFKNIEAIEYYIKQSSSN